MKNEFYSEDQGNMNISNKIMPPEPEPTNVEGRPATTCKKHGMGGNITQGHKAGDHASSEHSEPVKQERNKGGY